MSACVTWMVSVGLIGSLVLCPVYGDPEQIKAKPGENVTLQCRGSKDATTVMLRWVRPDLKSEGCVFDFRDHKINEEAQHEAFHSRVDLRDPEMKDGNFSVILKNIRISDTGSYECYVGKRKPGNLVPEPVELINSTTLKVEDSGHTGGQSGAEGDQDGGDNHGPVGLAVGLTVVGILLLVAAVVGFMFYRKRSRPTDQNPNPRPEQTPMNPK
ncbi:uncharacterized protein LOC113140849 isoform X2 [Mastacembelus armatus]|uniref:uncharacterized protein LOC113140849 isoform X2 n=1 Tax=Mastacembelus armatus TaxID=205130 RepID=UPI000E465CDC|nr:uncharacterized protein LOC113140849 isoform X2 [Mastacembelus armatus]